MRILFCSEQPPVHPLDDGIRLPLHALIGNLGQQHEVRVLAFIRAGAMADPGNHVLRLVPWPSTNVFGDGALVARAELTGRPLRADSLARRMQPALREEVTASRPMWYTSYRVRSPACVMRYPIYPPCSSRKTRGTATSRRPPSCPPVFGGLCINERSLEFDGLSIESTHDTRLWWLSARRMRTRWTLSALDSLYT